MVRLKSFAYYIAFISTCCFAGSSFAVVPALCVHNNTRDNSPVSFEVAGGWCFSTSSTPVIHGTFECWLPGPSLICDKTLSLEIDVGNAGEFPGVCASPTTYNTATVTHISVTGTKQNPVCTVMK